MKPEIATPLLSTKPTERAVTIQDFDDLAMLQAIKEHDPMRAAMDTFTALPKFGTPAAELTERDKLALPLPAYLSTDLSTGYTARHCWNPES